MSKNFKIKNEKQKKKSQQHSEIKLWTMIVSGFLVLAILCSLAVSGLGNWVDKQASSGNATPTPVVDNTVIEFGDEALETFVKTKLGIKNGDVTVNKVNSVTTFQINGLEEISSLKGLEKFPSMTTLKIEDAKLMDISDLADSGLLKSLQFYNCDLSETVVSKDNEKITSILFNETVPTAAIVSKFTKAETVKTVKSGLTSLEAFVGMPALEEIDLNEEKGLLSLNGAGSIVKLERLFITSSKVESFEGIQSSTTIEEVLCDNSELMDISALTENDSVEMVHMPDCTVSGIADLGNMTELKELAINNVNNGVCDLSFLAEMTGLEVISISGIKTDDLDMLEGLDDLTFIEAEGCGLENVDGIKNAVKITDLILADNKLTDVTALKNMTSLYYLDVSDNRLSHFSALKNIYSLVYFDISGNASLRKLENMSSWWLLKELYASDCDLISVKIGDCTALEIVDLANNGISDISAISTLTSAKTVNLSGNRISKLPTLSALKALTTLYVDHNKIDNIDELEKVTTLTDLDIAYNNVTKVEKLKALTKLKKLNISGNGIKDIAFAEKLTALVELRAAENEIEKLDPIDGLTKLEIVDVSSNKISDITAFDVMDDLEEVYFSNNTVKMITSLKDKRSLKVLEFTNNQVESISVLSNCTALKTLKMKQNKITDYSVIKVLSLTVCESDDDSTSKSE